MSLKSEDEVLVSSRSLSRPWLPRSPERSTVLCYHCRTSPSSPDNQHLIKSSYKLANYTRLTMMLRQLHCPLHCELVHITCLGLDWVSAENAFLLRALNLTSSCCKGKIRYETKLKLFRPHLSLARTGGKSDLSSGTGWRCSRRWCWPLLDGWGQYTRENPGI